ncbi:reverse transcriptase domain-containing protein [Tanacetum coccineum]
MTGVPRSVAEHRLNIREGYSPVRQKKRGQTLERLKAIQAKVQKLVEASIMKEVYYHDWLSNPVMMAESDEEKTAFHTSQGVYCYTKMPFGLKNACATYQRLVDKDFDSQVGRNMEVYVDDLVIKSHTEKEMIRDINETPEGIKPCPDKTEAVLQLPSPRTIKEVQSLNGKLAKAEQAFTQLKQHLSELPLLVAPKPKEELIVYLAASPGAISVVLITERDTVQTPVYFVSRALQGPELNYSPMEKLVRSLVFTAKRLRRYFQAHPIAVITDQPIKQIMSRPDVAGRFLVEKQEENLLETPAMDIPLEPWTLFTDGSSSSKNEAEYEALMAGLRIAVEMGVRNVRVLVEILKEKSIHEEEVATVVEEKGTTWMTPIIDYLKDGNLPSDRKEARKLRIKARQYELLEGILYKQLFLKPWLRIAIGSSQGHATRILLANNAPGRTRNDTYMQRLSTGPFLEGSGKVKFVIVAMDYFTKLIEAKAVATITGNQVKKFVWDNIVCRFGLPREIISDNGKQFSDNPFKDWCDKLNITQRFASVKHPQSNGLVERENWSLGEGIKERLGEGNKNWVEELPHVLWAHHTMIKSSHDLLEEKRERAAICKAKAKMKMAKYYNARVRDVAFRPGDFVYRSNDASHTAAGAKLGPKWEGPYEVTEALGDGAYKLRTM